MASEKKIFSFKAEYQSDILPFFTAVGEEAIKRREMYFIKKIEDTEPELLESFVEFVSSLDLETLKKIADGCENCHRIEQTLRQCSMEENSFEWLG